MNGFQYFGTIETPDGNIPATVCVDDDSPGDLLLVPSRDVEPLAQRRNAPAWVHQEDTADARERFGPRCEAAEGG